MRVSEWGNYLSVRLPADLVHELGIKEGDEIDLVEDEETVHARHQPRADAILKALKRVRGILPNETRLCRDAAYKRGIRRNESRFYLIADDPGTDRARTSKGRGPGPVSTT